MQKLDVNHINPFLQSCITIVESTTMVKLKVGKPAVADLHFSENTFILQIGVTGALKGQVLIVMTNDNAKLMASRMMMGMPVETLDDMASSALSELGNMIMGNTATIFSTQGIVMDITPPMAMLGSNIKLTSEITALRIPLNEEDKTLIDLYLCVAQEDK